MSMPNLVKLTQISLLNSTIRVNESIQEVMNLIDRAVLREEPFIFITRNRFNGVSESIYLSINHIVTISEVEVYI